MATAAITDLFSRFGLTAKAESVILDTAGAVAQNVGGRAGSLNFEHVSRAVMRRGICALGEFQISDSGFQIESRILNLEFGIGGPAALHIPDAGILADFPATLLRALHQLRFEISNLKFGFPGLAALA